MKFDLLPPVVVRAALVRIMHPILTDEDDLIGITATSLAGLVDIRTPLSDEEMLLLGTSDFSLADWQGIIEDVTGLRSRPVNGF